MEKFTGGLKTHIRSMHIQRRAEERMRLPSNSEKNKSAKFTHGKTCAKRKQAGTGPSRRLIQGSKIAKRLPSVKHSLLQYSKIKTFSKKLHTQKNGPSAAPGPASASPWRAKRGTIPKLPTFLSQLKGGPFGEKTNF